jgi:hypothetical protein
VVKGIFLARNDFCVEESLVSSIVQFHFKTRTALFV